MFNSERFVQSSKRSDGRFHFPVFGVRLLRTGPGVRKYSQTMEGVPILNLTSLLGPSQGTPLLQLFLLVLWVVHLGRLNLCRRNAPDCATEERESPKA